MNSLIIACRTTKAPDTGRIILAGAVSIVAFAGVFGLWSTTAMLDSAAVAEGRVIVESQRKTVQHLEGGIVHRIFATEGMRVEAGTPLVVLDQTQTRSSLDTLRSQQDELLAREARLLAERTGSKAVTFPLELVARTDDPPIAELLDGQRRLFAARSETLEGQINILIQRRAQLDAEVAGLRAQVASTDSQLGFITEEMQDARGLVGKGLERKSRLLVLEREAANLQGRRGEYLASIARAGQRRGETDLQILDLHNKRTEEVAKDLREVQGSLREISERLHAAEDVLERTVVRAPVSGLVMNLQVHTAGGVVGAGKPILDIVPQDDNLLIEAKLRPADIDSVHTGLPAQIRLTAFKQWRTPLLSGRVRYVSGDALIDQRTGEASYSAHLVVDRGELQRAGGLNLQPGMPAEIMIVTGRRTALDYLLLPLKESFSRAFREE
jgi:HlyD family type I secretion membrane fusion protein